MVPRLAAAALCGQAACTTGLILLGPQLVKQMSPVGRLRPGKLGRSPPAVMMLIAKALVLFAALCLTTAAGDEPGRYWARVTHVSTCMVGPCPNTMITDRITGQVVWGATQFDLPPSEIPSASAKLEIGWDWLVDGVFSEDRPRNGVPVLRITKILGRVPWQ